MFQDFLRENLNHWSETCYSLIFTTYAFFSFQGIPGPAGKQGRPGQDGTTVSIKVRIAIDNVVLPLKISFVVLTCRVDPEQQVNVVHLVQLD